MNEAAVKWLREQIAARQDRAQACQSPSPWKAATHEADNWIVTDATGEVVVYDEGTPTLEEAAHIAANDPQQVTADCEMQLAILDEHRLVVAAVHACYAGSNYLENWSVAHDPPSAEDLARLAPGILEAHCRRCRCPFPCWDILNLMTAYRHQPGYTGWPATR